MEINYNDYLGKALARSARGMVIAMDEYSVAKLSYINSYEQLESESKKMSFANSINDLVVKFIELRKDKNETNLLVMERLYPLEYRALDAETRFKYFIEFELKLRELHNAGFVFRDLFLTVIKGGDPNFQNYTNFMLTSSGIRLIDTGISLLREDIGNVRFQNFVNQEIIVMRSVKNIILSNEIHSRTLT